MIQVLIDHSYEEDYYVISTINVEVKNPDEKKRLEDLIKKLELESKLVDGFDDIPSLLADVLKVDKNQIDIEVNDIDMM